LLSRNQLSRAIRKRGVALTVMSARFRVQVRLTTVE
jgi:hypothetical protein